MTALKIDRTAYKIGLNEIEGLQDAMRDVLKPVLELVQSKVYWNSSLNFIPVEYKSRDGFWAHSNNCGGLELSLVIPSCESYDFDFLEFGECDPEYCDCHSDISNGCSLDIDGHKDAKLRVWLKFEGLKDGVMGFYLVMSGGNGDAPYFREKSQATLYESEFSVKTLAQFKREATKHVKKLIKVME